VNCLRKETDYKGSHNPKKEQLVEWDKVVPASWVAEYFTENKIFGKIFGVLVSLEISRLVSSFHIGTIIGSHNDSFTFLNKRRNA
jgi:hypothetical protein